MKVIEKSAITAFATPDTMEPRKFCSFSGLNSRSTCAPIVSEMEMVETFSEKYSSRKFCSLCSGCSNEARMVEKSTDASAVSLSKTSGMKMANMATPTPHSRSSTTSAASQSGTERPRTRTRFINFANGVPMMANTADTMI